LISMTMVLKLWNWGVSKMLMNRGKLNRQQKAMLKWGGVKAMLEAGEF